MKRIVLLALAVAALLPAVDVTAGEAPRILHLGKPGAMTHAVAATRGKQAPADAKDKGYWTWAGPSHHPYGKIR